MKFLKRTFYTLIFLGIFIFIFRGWLYRNLITYKTIGERRNYTITNSKLKDYIDRNSEKEQSEIKKIITTSLEITSGNLCYNLKKNQNDPNLSFQSKSAHCVGYASHQAAVFNYLIEKHTIKNWKAKPFAGNLYLAGYNIHKLFQSAAFRDHDFVEIKNAVTGECFYTDPTIHDYLNITFIDHK